MLDVMRAGAKSWIAKLLFGLLILSFAIWGVGDYVNRKANEPVAVVNGRAIGPNTFGRAYEEELNRLRQASGGKVDKAMADKLGLKEQVLLSLINRNLLLAAVRDHRLTIAPATLRDQIANNPAFVRNGKFDKVAYERALSGKHLSPQEYEAGLVQDLTLRQLQTAIRTVAAVPQPLVADTFTLSQESRAVALLLLDPKELEGGLRPDDATLGQYLSDHAERFLTPPKVKLRYIVLDSDSVRQEVKVREEEIAEFYEENQAQFRQEETRQARHLLAKVNGADKTDEAARTLIAKAQQRLAKGEAFDKVAKELSEDASAAQGGDLGQFGRGMMVPAFEEAAFRLKEGEVSAPVRSPFGYHLIKVEKITPAKTRSLAEVKADIQMRITLRKSQELIYERSTTLEDQVFASGDLKAIAKDLNLRYRETDYLSRTGTLEGIENLPKFLDTAFATQTGQLSPLVETEDGRFFVLEAVAREEPRPRLLEEAREELRVAYVKEQAQKLAREQMDKLLAALREGKPWTEAAKALSVKVREEKPKPFTYLQGAGPEQVVRQAAFQLQPGEPLYPRVVENGPQLAIVRLLEVNAPKPEAFKAAEPTLRAQLAENLAEELFAAYLVQLRQQADLTLNRQMLERF